MTSDTSSLPVVAVGTLPRAARAALRRAGARMLVAADADGALTAALDHDALLVVCGPGLPAAQGAALQGLLSATGRAGDLLSLAPGGAAGPRTDRRSLARRLRRRARERRQTEADLAARPGWAEMVAAYRAYLRDCMAGLARAIDTADGPAALVIAHDIKGTAAGYGLGQLTGLSRQAQDHFLDGNPAAGLACCAQLLQRAEEALR